MVDPKPQDLTPPKPSEAAIALWRQRRAEKAAKGSKASTADRKAAADALREVAKNSQAQRKGTIIRTAGAGGTCMVRLNQPYGGLKEIPAIAMDGCHAHQKVVCFLTENGQWAALGKGNERIDQQRAIARSAAGLYTPITGRVGYLCLTMVGKQPNAAQGQPPITDYKQWQWFWQLWVGGLTENMILVREWRIFDEDGYRASVDNPQTGVNENTTWPDGFWHRAFPPTAVLDVRSDAFYVSLEWRERYAPNPPDPNRQPDTAVNYYFALFKGNPDTTVNEQGEPAEAIQTVWMKSTAELTAADQRFSGFVPYCMGFGYWVDRNNKAGLINLTESFALHNGQVRVYTGPDQEVVQGVVMKSSLPVPIGWQAAPLNSTFEYTNSYPNVDWSVNRILYRPLRVSADGFQALVSTFEQKEILIKYSLNELDIGQKDLTTSTVFSDNEFLYDEEPNIPYVLRDGENVPTAQWDKSLQLQIATSSFSVKAIGRRITDPNLIYAPTSNPIFYALPSGFAVRRLPGFNEVGVGTSANLDPATFFSYTIAGYAYKSYFSIPRLNGSGSKHIVGAASDPTNEESWFYAGQAEWNDEARRSPYFCDVYQNFVSLIDSETLVGRAPANGWPMFWVFPEMVPAGSIQAPWIPEAERQAAIAKLEQNIEHQDMECTVYFLNIKMTGKYKQGKMKVTALKAKQIKQLVDQHLEEGHSVVLAKYAFLNASFAADNE